MIAPEAGNATGEPPITTGIAAAPALPRALRDNLVWDNHGCMPLRPLDDSFLPQLAQYRANGVDVAMLNIGFGEQGIDAHVRMLAAFRRWLAMRPDDYVIIRTVDDIAHARAHGKLAIGFDIEGANAIGDQLSLLALYYDLGVRWMLMAYNRNNRVGGGCHDDDGGLTGFGYQVLDEMARIGMVACCTHTGYRTAMDVLTHSANPVLFSHSNARALVDHPRNITDEMALACAATGGVVGLNGIGLFLGRSPDLVDAFVRHVDHMVELVGPSHVGIGLDHLFDTAELDDFMTSRTGAFPVGMGYDGAFTAIGPGALPEIVNRLGSIGYSDAVLAEILGRNLLRVADQVWKAPASA